MAIFRVQENVPDVYPRKSRDFQLFSNLFDCVNGGIKYDIDSIVDTIDTNQCNERVLSLLQTKLGFLTNEKVSSTVLRTILKGFPYIVKNKGSLKGIIQAINLFLKAYNLYASSVVRVINEGQLNGETFIISIGVSEKLPDIAVLNEILKYVIPAGYKTVYTYYNPDSDGTTILNLEYADTLNIVMTEQALNRSVKLQYTDEDVIAIKRISNVSSTAIVDQLPTIETYTDNYKPMIIDEKSE